MEEEEPCIPSEGHQAHGGDGGPPAREEYARHSLRRGGATAARQVEVHSMFVKGREKRPLQMVLQGEFVAAVRPSGCHGGDRSRYKVSTGGLGGAVAKGYGMGALTRSSRGASSTGARVFVAFYIVFTCSGCLGPWLPAPDDVLVWFTTFSSWIVARAPSGITGRGAAATLQRGHARRLVSERYRVTAALQDLRKCRDRPSGPVVLQTVQNPKDMSRHVELGSLSGLHCRQRCWWSSSACSGRTTPP